VFVCDWWSCGDGQTFHRVEAVGLPVLFVMQPDCSWYRQTSAIRDRFARHRVVGWDKVRDSVTPPNEWSNWSVTAALALAVEQGASRVDVYGHDCRGIVDVSGHTLAKREDTWKRASNSVPHCWRITRDWAASRGVEIIEHQPEIDPCESPPSSPPRA